MSSRSKNIWPWLLGFSGLLVAGIVGFRSCAFSFWEETLIGPFAGAEYSGALPSAPVSFVSGPRGTRLEVYEASGQSVPVLALRSPEQKLEWRRLLLPQKDNRTAGVRNLRLESIKRYSAGYRLFVICDWDWGGHERGVVYLNPDLTFREFALSW